MVLYKESKRRTEGGKAMREKEEKMQKQMQQPVVFQVIQIGMKQKFFLMLCDRR